MSFLSSDATVYHPGAISFIQRFGSSLNLNLHIHSQVGDGVYARRPDGRLFFLRVPSPTDNDLRKITIKIACRVHRYLEKRMSEVVIYADDFIITGATKEVLLEKVKPVVIKFLQTRGLTLSEEKTMITHIDDGFDFLGFNLRKYKGKMLTKPSRER